MRKTALFFTLLLIVMTSCSRMESNEKKFLKGMQSEDYETSTKAFEEFTNWLQTDKSTMTHDFMLMQKELGMKVATSPDSQVRCYSWLTGEEGGAHSYANVVQWMWGEKFVGFCGPLNRLIANRKDDFDKEFARAHSIDTIFEISSSSQPIYLIAQSYINANGKRRAMVSAVVVAGTTLAALPTFFDGMEIAGNYEFVDSVKTPIGNLFKWDEKKGSLQAYQTDDKYNVIPGKYATYVLGKERFTRLPEEQTTQESTTN